MTENKKFTCADRLKELQALSALLTYARENAIDIGEQRLAEAAELARLAAIDGISAARSRDDRDAS